MDAMRGTHMHGIRLEKEHSLCYYREMKGDEMIALSSCGVLGGGWMGKREWGGENGEKCITYYLPMYR